VKWRKPVLPGDTVVIETEITAMKRSIGKAIGRCVVNGQVVSEADLMFALVDR
jgi:UDP-3-O-[3-hydroxymyristoyl] N-acetylglucosamine deacetylase/3-hydroxyacyl-[acyl-carrier-protein] dehydratase